MTYQPLNSLSSAQSAIASPQSVSLVTFANNVSAVSGAIVSAASITAPLGTALSLSSGAIVLPAGYWYYLEGTAQAQVPSGTLSVGDYVDMQWHDGTAYVGSVGRTSTFARVDGGTQARDEKALALIDATASSVTVTFRILTAAGQVTTVNATGTHQEYAGRTRAMIIQLEAP